MLVLLALLLGAATPRSGVFDRAVFHMMAMQQGFTPATWIGIAQSITHIGDLSVRAVILIVGLAVFAWRRAWREMATLLTVAVTAAVLTDVVKASFARPRPTIYPYIGEFSNYSYPSGHASNTMALMLAVGLLARSNVLTIFGAMTAVAVGATRTMLDVHWPTDVIGGWLIGAGVAFVICGRSAQRGAMRIAPSRRTSSPLK